MEFINKICAKCKIEKPITEFKPNLKLKSGLNSWCNQCTADYHLKYRKENKENLAKKAKNYYYCNLKNDPNYKQKSKENNKKWAQENKQKRNQINKKWQEKNKEYINRKRSEYSKMKRETDPMFKLKMQIRTLVSTQFKLKSYKKSSKTEQLLGNSWAVVFDYLQETAVINYGAYNPSGKYHIDHIIPCSTAKTEKELIALQHYKNLQLLTPADNLAKSDNLEWKSPYQLKKK